MPQPLAVIIEDQANLALLYEDALRLVGYSTLSIRDGLEGLNHLETNEVPDLVILDVNLPGMSGRDLLKHIRGSKKFSTLPVIILTANTLMVTQIQKETTALDYLFIKPIGMKKLQELAKSVKRGVDGTPQHIAETQKVPHLDEDGNVILPDDTSTNRNPQRNESNIETQETRSVDSFADTQEHEVIKIDDDETS